MNKQPEITDATREAFVTAFFRLASIKNIHQITIREITNLAGYNRTTFYRYFVDVYALIEHAEDCFVDDMLSSVIPLLGDQKEVSDDFFKIYLSKFYEHRERLMILLSEQNRAHFIRRVQEQTIMYLNTPIDNTPKNRVVMNMYMTAVFTAIADQLLGANPINKQELLDLIKKLFQQWYWPEVS